MEKEPTFSHTIPCGRSGCDTYIKWRDNKPMIDPLDTDVYVSMDWWQDNGAWVCQNHPKPRVENLELPIFMGPMCADLAGRGTFYVGSDGAMELRVKFEKSAVKIMDWFYDHYTPVGLAFMAIPVVPGPLQDPISSLEDTNGR